MTGMSDVRHRCPVTLRSGEGCPQMVHTTKLMCVNHWHMVPAALQRALYAAYDRGRGRGTETHLHAMDACIQAVDERLAA